MSLIYRAILVIGVLFIVTAQEQAMAQIEPKLRTIRLDATGSVKAKPDIAHITLGVSAEAETARGALDQNSAAMAKVIDALKQSGLAGADMQTIDFSVRPRIEASKPEGKKNVITGYTVVNMLRITVRDMTKLGEILDKAVSLGSNEIGGIQFDIAQPAALMDDARRQAMALATRKAELYAQAAGAKLVRVISIDEQSAAPWRPQNMSVRASARAMEAPIEQGEAELQVSISVTWELGDAPKP